MIDFDNPKTFPPEMDNIISEYSDFILKELSKGQAKEDYEIESVISDWRWHNNEIINRIKCCLETSTFKVWHVARIEDEKDYYDNGIIVMINNENAIQQRMINLLKRLNLSSEEINNIVEKANVYWKRDGEVRSACIHFFFGKDCIEDPRQSVFAINLGGEIMNWSLRSIDSKLYQKEPYKRLWIWGKPCIISFRCRFDDMHELTQETIILELVKYYVFKKIYNIKYKFDCTGIKIGNVDSKDIIDIEIIDNFYDVHSQFEIEGFYDEVR